MPQRVVNAWLVAVGLAGLAAVGLWAFCGRDARAAARTGPRWKRVLLAAGLAMLAAFGWAPSPSEAREPAPAADTGDASDTVMALFRMQAQMAELARLTAARDVNGPAITAAADTIESLAAVLRKPGGMGGLTPKGQAEAARLLALAEQRVPAARALVPAGTTDLARSAQWQVVADAWRTAGPLAASGKSSTAQRKEADAKLKSASEALAALTQAGLLTAAEAGLLAVDAARLRTEIYRNPPTDMQVKCYDMAFMPPARTSLKRLQQQVLLLKTIAAAKKLAPAALDKVVVAIERDLAILADPKQTTHLTVAQKPRAEDLRKQVAPLVAQIKRRVLAARVGQTAGWAKVDEALTFGTRLGLISSTAQRDQFNVKLAAAGAALAALAGTGVVTEGESALIKGELDHVRGEVFRRPPTDTQVKCYKMMYIPPARRSFDRLKARLGLLKKLAESGRLNPTVLAKVLPTVRADVEMLSSEKELAKLGQARAEAEAVRKQIATVLSAIEKQLGAARPDK